MHNVHGDDGRNQALPWRLEMPPVRLPMNWLVVTAMDDPVTDKLQNLHDDVARRDAVCLRMHLHELARRDLYDDVLDALTRDSWSTGFDEDVWRLVAERLAAVSQTHENALGLT